MLSDLCLSRPACNIGVHYCGQTVGWIKMKLGTQVGLGPGHTVLDGDPAPLPQKGAEPYNFRPMSIVASTAGWIKMPPGMEVCLGPGHIVLDGDPAPPPPKGHSPQFPAHICCNQMAGWIKMQLGMEAGLSPSDIVRWGLRSPAQKGRNPYFRPVSIVAKRLEGLRCHLVRK